MINNIQVLRALAALMVVYYHIIGAINSYHFGNVFTNNLSNSSWGAYGVDVFFVISGFIMVNAIMKKNKNPLQFFKDRLVRIVPLYWIFTSVFIIIYFVAPNLFREKVITNSDITYSFLFSQQLFNNKEPILILGWTLEYEMLFYGLFALALFTKSIYSTVITCSLSLIMLIGFGLNNIVIEFIIGMIIALMYPKLFISNKITKNLIGYISILLASILLYMNAAYFPSDRLLVIIAASLMFIGFLSIKTIHSNIALLIGNASYSLYLIQIFTIPIFMKIWILLPTNNSPFFIIITIIACLVFTTIAAIISYYLLEKPLLKLMKTSTRSKQ